MKKKTRVLALILAIILCLISLPLSALAYSGGTVVNDDTGEIIVAPDPKPEATQAPGSFIHGQVVDDDTGETIVLPSSDTAVQVTADSGNGSQITEADIELAKLLETEGAEILVLPDGSFGKAVSANSKRVPAAGKAASTGTLHVGYYTFAYNVGYLESLGYSLTQCPAKTLVSNGEHTAAYCLDEALGATHGHGYTQISEVLTDRDLRTLLGDILATGYQYKGSSTVPTADGYKWAITQIMIWQAIYGSIYRDENGVNVFKPAVTTEVEKCAAASGHYSEYWAYFASMKSKLESMRKIPSFAYRKEDEAIGKDNKNVRRLSQTDDDLFSLTLNDTNKVLSHFDFTFSDPSLSTFVNGNYLRLTSTSEMTNAVVSQKATHTIQGGENSIMVYKPASQAQQRIAVCDPQDDPVSAYIAVQTGEADPDNPEQPETSQWRAVVTKRDSETGTAQGDATLAGAVYGVYHNGTLLDTYVTNASGKFTTDYYDCGEGYTLKEISPSKGYLLNSSSISLNTTAAGEELITLTASAPETVIKGKVRITKHSDKGETGIETPEEGAEFRIWLTSAGSYEAAKSGTRDEITINADGVAKTKPLPYGTYTVQQTEGKEGTEKIADFQVSIVKNNETYSFIANNRVYEALITVMKKDAETDRMIPASGITFQIRDVKTGEFVTQHINYPTPMDISYFQTDSQGKLCMPEKLEYGEYELIEYATAYGYVLDTTPVSFAVDGTAKEVTVEKSNVPQKGVIQLEKTGEVLKGAEEQGGYTVPKYDKAGLSGVEFTVTAAEDIQTPDGTLRYVTGEKIQTLITDENGQAETQLLYLGNYWIQETKGKDGYALDTEKKLVTLKYTNQEESIQYKTLALENKRRELRVEKLDSEFSGRKLSGARFDLWYDKDGDKAFDKEKDSLFGEPTEIEKGIYTLSYLPTGGFFLLETQSPAAYVLDETPMYFEVRATDTVIYRQIKNHAKTGSLLIKKTAEDGLIEGIKFTVSGKPLTGGSYVQEFETDENGEIHVTGLRLGEYTVSEVLDESTVRYIVESDKTVTVSYNETTEVNFFNKLRRGEVYVIKTDPDYPDSKLTGAKFRVWKDSDGSMTFDSNKDKVCGFLQEKDGVYWLDGLAAGGYFLQEEIAPEGYVRDTEYHYFEIEEDTSQVEVTNTPDPDAGFVNRKMRGSLVIYKKSGTGESLAGTNFCVKNEDGEVIAEGTTGSDGTVTFDELPCGDYVYQEVSAPAGYERDNFEHSFSITSKKLTAEETVVNHQAPFYTPKTGDGRLNPTFWMLILILAVGGAAIVAGILIRKKGKK